MKLKRKKIQIKRLVFKLLQKVVPSDMTIKQWFKGWGEVALLTLLGLLVALLVIVFNSSDLWVNVVTTTLTELRSL